MQSSVNFWGYSLFKNKQKIRVRAGSSEDGTILEYGEPLKQELKLLSNSKIGEEGQRIYSFDDLPNETFEEDQVGENFIFEISSRFFGQNLDLNEDLLFNTELKGFKFNAANNKFNHSFDDEKKLNKWLILIFIFTFIVVLRILRSTIFNK